MCTIGVIHGKCQRVAKAVVHMSLQAISSLQSYCHWKKLVTPAGGCCTYLSSKVHDSINLLLIEYMPHQISGLDVALYKLRQRRRQRQFVELKSSQCKFESARG